MTRYTLCACAGLIGLASLWLHLAIAAGAAGSLNDPPAISPGCGAIEPLLVADGRGGAIVIWEDSRATGPANLLICAQHVLAGGGVDPSWPPAGLELGFTSIGLRGHAVVGDGAGGAIVAWADCRKAMGLPDESWIDDRHLPDLDIYAQRVRASGTLDPRWPGQGRALCTARNAQKDVTAVSDGNEGAIVAWSDFRASRRGGKRHVYAQHVLGNGKVDASWPADGREVCPARRLQSPQSLVPDGAGGAIVAWMDWRGENADLYAQHLRGSGAVDTTWPAAGRALCTAPGDQFDCGGVSDGAGGAIFAWQDYRLGDPSARGMVYTQRVDAGGALDPTWPANGRTLCANEYPQYEPAITGDGTGGAIVAWVDYHRRPCAGIYVQRVLTSGPDSTWPAEGLALCTAENDQQHPAVVADSSGGAVVVWADRRDYAGPDLKTGLYAQHVLRNGEVDRAWPAEGLAVDTVPGCHWFLVIVTDGAGGAIVAWTDRRGGGFGLYVQHVLACGKVDPAWPVDGLAICGPEAR